MATEQVNLRFKMLGSTGTRTITFANIRSDVIDSSGNVTTDAQGSIEALADWLARTTQYNGEGVSVDKVEIVRTEVTEVEV